MKKSEYIAAREKAHAGWQPLRDRVSADVAAAEAAGVVWDPEEEPLPATLVIEWRGDAAELLSKTLFAGGRTVAMLEFGGSLMQDEERRRLLLSVLRRYESWPRLAEIQRRLDNLSWGDDEDLDMIKDDLAAILDGKEVQ